ncbi:helix-turn-helix domain-containing protein [Candidatus Bipolaricaulota bacterium]
MTSLVSSPSAQSVNELVWEAAQDRKLTHGAFRLLALLLGYRSDFMVRDISVDVLASDLGVSVRTIRDYISNLVENRYIERRDRGCGMSAVYFLKVLFEKAKSFCAIEDRQKPAAPNTGPNHLDRNPLSQNYVLREREGSDPCSLQIETRTRDELPITSCMDVDEPKESGGNFNPPVTEPPSSDFREEVEGSIEEAAEDSEAYRRKQVLAEMHFLLVRGLNRRTNRIDNLANGFVRDGGLDRPGVREDLAQGIAQRAKLFTRGTADHRYMQRVKREFEVYYGVDLTDVLAGVSDDGA